MCAGELITLKATNAFAQMYGITVKLVKSLYNTVDQLELKAANFGLAIEWNFHYMVLRSHGEGEGKVLDS